MGYFLVLAASAVVLLHLPACVFSEKTIKIPVNQKDAPPLTDCKGARCPLLLIEQIYFAGYIEIGSNKQKILVAFDTGSSYSWVPSSLICSTNKAFCETHQTYDHTTSQTYVPDNTPVQIRYIDGVVSGFYSQDDITVGGITVHGQTFAEVTSNNFQQDYITAIFGLGFLENGVPDPPFIKMARTKVIENAVFAFYFDKNNKKSELILGGADPSHFQPPMVFVPVTPSIYWAITIDRILVNNVEIASGYPAIVDSGCSHIAGPRSIIDSINQDVGTRDREGMVYPDCRKISSFPTVVFIINKARFVMRPADYILYKDPCESGFMSVKRINEMILGNVWMVKFYTVFDVDGKQIGFAEAK